MIKVLIKKIREPEDFNYWILGDDDPLLFYRAIAECALSSLAPGGWGMVEINETLGPETARLFEAAGLRDVRLSKDFAEKDRFLSFSS